MQTCGRAPPQGRSSRSPDAVVVPSPGSRIHDRFGLVNDETPIRTSIPGTTDVRFLIQARWEVSGQATDEYTRRDHPGGWSGGPAVEPPNRMT